MTTAQIVFSIALGVITLIIMAFAVYVVASTVWGNRWVKTEYRKPESKGSDS